MNTGRIQLNAPPKVPVARTAPARGATPSLPHARSGGFRPWDCPFAVLSRLATDLSLTP